MNIARLAPLAIVAVTLGMGHANAERTTACSASNVRLSVEDVGAATEAALFLKIRTSSECSVSGRAWFEIEQAGRRARIRGNPLMVPLDAVSGPNEAHVWWANWCGSRLNLQVVARYAGRTIHDRFNRPSSRLGTLPACIDPSAPSTLRPPAS